MMNRCCPSCFGDTGLENNIIPSLEPTIGDCSFCNSKGVFIIEPGKLYDYFELLINVYEEDPHGKTLIEWLKDDWELFSHPVMDNAHAKELLSEVLDNGDVTRKKFIPSSQYISNGLAQWDTLRDELLNRNRYFLNEKIDNDRLSELLSHLKAHNFPELWYRSRINQTDISYKPEEMGAPPGRLASYGRANPIGIPYLYLGSTAETAISETRPHTGEVATVASFQLANSLSIVDLRHPKKHVSPFLLTDSEEIGKMRADIPFLEKLGEELTRPVLPRSAAIDYIPSQYLCEFIKRIGFHGVIYRSSVSVGMNLALFDPGLAEVISCSQYVVDQVSVNVLELK